VKSKKSALWVVLLVLGLAIFAGGCGGGGGGDSSYTPEDGNSSGSGTEFDFSALSGTWNAVRGTATVGPNEQTVALTLNRGTVDIDLATTSSNGATAYIGYDFYWNARIDGRDVTEHYDHTSDRVTVKRDGPDTFSYIYTDGNQISVKITSNTTATVTETGTIDYGSDKYPYRGKYYLEKEYAPPSQPDTPSQPDPPAQPVDDLSAYSGTWTAVPGSVQNATAIGYDGTYTLGLSSGTTNIAFSNVTASSAVATVTSHFVWHSYYGGYAVSTIPLDYTNQIVNVSRSSPTTLQYTFDSGSTVSVAFGESSATVTVTERGTFVFEDIPYQYQGTYRMTKTN
jgi:hypothetical protein